jgi:hypothetical protein
MFKIAMAAFSSWRPCLGQFPFLKKLFADGGYQGPKFETALAKALLRLHLEIGKRSDAQPLQDRPPARGRRAQLCVAQSLSKARQGLGEPQSQGARIPASRFHSPYAKKAL